VETANINHRFDLHFTGNKSLKNPIFTE